MFEQTLSIVILGGADSNSACLQVRRRSQTRSEEVVGATTSNSCVALHALYDLQTLSVVVAGDFASNCV